MYNCSYQIAEVEFVQCWWLNSECFIVGELVRRVFY